MALPEALLDAEVQEFIIKFEGDISKLAFAGSPFPNVPTQALLEQISSRKQIKDKLPKWYGTKNIYYPPKLNLEQTSSEITAQHKAEYVKGNKLADLTGGFGIDCYYFSLKMDSVSHFEQNELLSEIATHNFKQLGVTNVDSKTGDSLELLKGNFDTIYVDPGRRTEDKNKVFLLEDCLPNIPANLERILKHTELLILKTSPMLDISQGLSELKNVSSIHIVAINNEVKELLWFIQATPSFEELKIQTFNYSKDKVQTFETSLRHDVLSEYNAPATFLYEPNAAILKSGAFHDIALQYNLKKLAKNSHLYTGEELIDFPGRRFEIVQVLPYHKKEMAVFKKTKANVSIRNFSESVAEIRKKWKIKDGGKDYLFFTSLENKERVVIHGKPIR